ncbi:DNA-directed RNA polymerase specialized sigma24 family protein [Streptomyces sp. BK239]|nr:DNA-directed RNA polymerase specialized sigma24 family protein [Streptomyces sp. BK239]
MSSRPQTPTRTTGAHRAHREACDRAEARTPARRPRGRSEPSYEPYLDGLFTYCLSVLCEHDAATAALADVLALAERRGQRVPDAPGDRRAWLYALARWACLRELAEARRKRQGTHAAGRQAAPGASGAKPAEAPPADLADEARQQQRRRELALLAWPEAAGTTPEQREALELAVRHQLAAHEVAAVLGMEHAAARELLATAACEVERTRAALAVVETGGCPGVDRLSGDDQLVLSAALRRELVRHVDDCPRCRRAAERAVPGRWPGAGVTPAELPVLEAPRATLRAATARLSRARGAAAPRFDRRGFPMDPKDRAARRDRLRARAVTTTVVATVVAAPVIALWAAYRSTPTTEGADGRNPAASEAQDPGGLDSAAAGGYQNAGNASTRPGGRASAGDETDVSVEVISVAGLGEHGVGRLSVRAGTDGATTLITLTAAPDAPEPIRWSATATAPWLHLSRSRGVIAPGDSTTVKVYVDRLREPAGHWHARVAIAPAGAVVSIDGYGVAPAPADPGPGRPTGAPPSQGPVPSPTAPPTTPPASSPPPATADPEPTPDPSTPDPGVSTPPPGDGGEEGGGDDGDTGSP